LKHNIAFIQMLGNCCYGI